MRTVKNAIILVGGWGTRLRPLTYSLPKPLVPFCNKAMIQYQIEKLADAGITEIILAVNYHSEQIIEQCRKYEKEYGIRLICSKEETPLGTAGPIALARPFLENGPFFVLNSDISSDVNLIKMKTEFENSTEIGMIMGYSVEDPSRYGLMRVENGKVVDFVEKPAPRDGNAGNSSDKTRAGPNLINGGVYLFSSEILEYLEIRNMSLEREVFPILCAQRRLRFYRHTGYWMDIGQISDYLKGQEQYLRNEKYKDIRISTESSPENSAEMNCECLMSAERNVVIGKGVKIGKNVVLSNCTIMDGAVLCDGVVVTNSVIGWECVIGRGSVISDVSALGKGVLVAENVRMNSARIGPAVFEANEIEQLSG